MTTTANRSGSKATMDRARQVLPGGVDSPVRAYKAVGGEPVVVTSGSHPPSSPWNRSRSTVPPAST